MCGDVDWIVRMALIEVVLEHFGRESWSALGARVGALWAREWARSPSAASAVSEGAFGIGVL